VPLAGPSHGPSNLRNIPTIDLPTNGLQTHLFKTTSESVAMERGKGGEKSEEKEFVDISKKDNGGLLKKILKAGSGDLIPQGVVAIVHYTGRLTTGEVFDSSKARGIPFEFNLGEREVILGWDEGVKTMTKGEIAILKCSPDYGYGGQSIGPIPGNSTLLFEVELLDWKKKENLSLNKVLLALMVLGGMAAMYVLYSRQ
jgi:FKBP-type peptidyl-prolyl cis-trans isomerase